MTNGERLTQLRDQASAAGCTIRTMYRRQRCHRTAAAVAEVRRCYDARVAAHAAVGTADISNWPRDFVEVAERDSLREFVATESGLSPTEKVHLLEVLPAVPTRPTEGFVSRAQMLSQLPSETIARD